MSFPSWNRRPPLRRVLVFIAVAVAAPRADSQRPADSVFVHVDVPARLRAHEKPPIYPDLLRRGHIEGEVVAQFVVDTLGRIEVPSFRVLKSTHELFTAAVWDRLTTWRFTPAIDHGRRVRQRITGAFEFPPGRSGGTWPVLPPYRP